MRPNPRNQADDDTEKCGPGSIGPTSSEAIRTLTVVHSPDATLIGRRMVLGQAQTLFFGRDDPSGFSIRDHRMSKQHFLVVSKGSGLECADLGSTNGTFVDGRLVQTSALLHGSVIRAGDTIFIVTSKRPRCDLDERALRCASTQFPILLQGETGTGKEVMARKIHAHSGRNGPFVPVNCATLSKDLAATELFGHIKGAYSGASGTRLGLFRTAEGGSLFLDEIGDLPLELQSTLLRVLEDRRVRPVGSDQEAPIDVRVICATNVELHSAVQEQRFRADLYARIAHVVLTLLPLRERRESILELAREFGKAATLTANAAESLVLWDWPRNLRELRSLIEVATQLGRQPGQIHLADLTAVTPAIGAPLRSRKHLPSVPAASPEQTGDRRQMAERRTQLQQMFEASGGNVSQVAQQLGKPRAQIYRWAKALGLDAAQFRK